LRKNCVSPSRLSGVGRRGKGITKRMPVPKTMSTVETVARINLSSLTVEEEIPTLTTAQPRPALPSRVAVVGNYLPRKCGIATFTTDLCDAIHAEYGAMELLALPVNDTEEGYSYPARVRFELSEDKLASYRQAADFLNFSNIDLVCLQHEYGIFGVRPALTFRTFTQPSDARGHDVAHGPSRAQHRSAHGDGGNCDSVGSSHCHEPAIRRYPGRSVSRLSGQKSISSPMGSPICRLPIPVSSRMPSEPKEKMYCSRSASFLQTRESKT